MFPRTALENLNLVLQGRRGRGQRDVRGCAGGDRSSWAPTACHYSTALLPIFQHRQAMPLTRISAPRHLEFSKVKSLADAVQDGLVQTCKVPPNDLFQIITRCESEEMILDPTFGGVNRSRDACIAEITFLRGRTDDQKRDLFKHIAARAVAAGFRPDDVMVALTENSHMDWSLGRGLAYADHVQAEHSKA